MAFKELKKYWILPLILVLGLLALFIFKTTVPEQPGVKIEPASWLLGDVVLGQEYKKEIRIKNSSLFPLEIVKVRPSCECITAEIKKPISSLDSEAIIAVSIEIKRSLGTNFNAFVYIHAQKPAADLARADSGKPEIFRFDIQGHVTGTSFDLKNTEITIFRTKAAQNYDIIHQKLGLLKEKFPEYSINENVLQDTDSYRRLAKYEKEYSVINRGTVEMFKGDRYFVDNEILSELEKLLTGSPLNLEPHDNALEILFFYSAVCAECRSLKQNLFPKILEKYSPRINVREMDISVRENYEILTALEDEYQIKANPLVTVFVGKKYLLGKHLIEKNLDVLIEQELKTYTPASRTAITPSIKSGQHSIRYKFASFTVGAVVLAGLVDGVNPCVFATIIFFISFLTFAGRSRKEILAIGIVYIITVFVTYLLLGIGFFRAIQELSSFSTISEIVLYTTITVVFLLAGLSIYDIIIYRKTRQSKDMTLQLPLSVKQKIHTIIRENVKIQGLVIGAIVIGFLVTLFEALCTGQVYLPTIVFMLQEPILKNHAIAYLLLYNLLFIATLVAVFLLAYFGVSSKKFSEFSQKNVLLVKASLALFFVGIGIALLLA